MEESLWLCEQYLRNNVIHCGVIPNQDITLVVRMIAKILWTSMSTEINQEKEKDVHSNDMTPTKLIYTYVHHVKPCFDLNFVASMKFLSSHRPPHW